MVPAVVLKGKDGMHSTRKPEGSPSSLRVDPVSRRDFLSRTTMAGAVGAAATKALAHGDGDVPPKPAATTPLESLAAPGRAGLLFPQQNTLRNVLDISGIWDFQLDPQEEGEDKRWFQALPAPRPIPVPCSWNDLFDDARDYLGLAWYRRETYVPPSWRGQRIFLRVGSANYAAKVWVNGDLVAEHLGGHLPFVADITKRVSFTKGNVIAISVENKQLPGRVPPGAGPGGGGVAGLMAGFPLTTYDFFPYAGLHRPVLLYSVPAHPSIDDVTVKTTIEGRDGVVMVRVTTADTYAGKGRVRLGGTETMLTFQAGTAEKAVRVPSARFWSPQDPHLYPLTVTLTQGSHAVDSYSLDVGIRTVAISGDQLLLNGQPVQLRGFGKHEDFPLSGRGQNLPVWIRDYELLRWVGANSYRTSHYPYAEEAMQLADRLGFLVINEIPAVGLDFRESDEVTAQRQTQALQELRELIARDKNHPSTIMWNVANEPLGGLPLGLGPRDARAEAAGMTFFRELYAEAHRLDDTRPVTLVGVQGGVKEWHGIFDVVCINRYYGWYTQPGQLELGRQALARELDELHQTFGKPIIVAEFGGDTIPGTHNTAVEMWTEEYQVEFLRGFLEIAAQRPFMAGMHVWAFADFKTGQGTGRAEGMNFKGVFTRDRRPKMAAHFLRSRWAQ